MRAQFLREDQANTHELKNRVEPEKAIMFLDVIRNISRV
jgi:hypothetical protein